MSLVVVLRDHRRSRSSGNGRRAAPHHNGLHQGLLGPEYTQPADPGTTNFVPRPGLVLLLPLLSAPDLQVAGVGVPRHGRRADDRARAADRAAVLRHAARAAPVAPAGRDGRRGARRPLDGGADLEGRDREGGARLGGRRGRPDVGQGGRTCRRAAVPGAKLFAVAGCTVMPHVPRLRAPRTSARPTSPRSERENLGIPFQIRHLQCPSCVNPGSPMPKFDSLGLKRLTELAIFLESSKGKQ